VIQGENPSDELIQPTTFLQAKIEHHLLRTEELIHMSRFLMANQTLQKVLRLDPDNRVAKSLEKRIEYTLSALSYHGEPMSVAVDTSNAVAHKRRRNQLVLIVDQDERVLLALTERLSHLGFDVICAAGFQEAIEELGSFKPAVVVSEVNFENGSAGFDLYLWIRTNSATAAIPFLFLATKIDRDTLIAGKRLGVDDFIMKPLDEDVVAASIIQSLTHEKKFNGTH